MALANRPIFGFGFPSPGRLSTGLWDVPLQGRGRNKVEVAQPYCYIASTSGPDRGSGFREEQFAPAWRRDILVESRLLNFTTSVQNELVDDTLIDLFRCVWRNQPLEVSQGQHGFIDGCLPQIQPRWGGPMLP
jgi:hypothetical protein